jgi:hypothetical protein
MHSALLRRSLPTSVAKGGEFFVGFACLVAAVEGEFLGKAPGTQKCGELGKAHRTLSRL